MGVFLFFVKSYRKLYYPEPLITLGSLILIFLCFIIPILVYLLYYINRDYFMLVFRKGNSRLISCAYCLSFYNKLNTTYHSYIIRLVIVSEFLIFLTFLTLYLYYNSNIPCFLSGVSYLNYIKLRYNFSEISVCFVFLALTSILISLKFFFFFLKSLASSNNYSKVSKDVVVFCLFLGIFFVFIQVLEFWSFTFSFFDSMVYCSVFGILFLHGFHVLVGVFCLCFLFLFCFLFF